LENREIILELSYFDLEGRTNSIMGPERKQKSNVVKLDNLMYIPMAGSGNLKIGSNTTSNNGHDYWSTLLFDNVTYLDEEDANGFKFTGKDNSEYYIERLPRNANVKVNCSCLDFHYRFAVWDNKFKALDGNPPAPYVKKGNRPPVNPMHSPGLCKHLIKLVNDLKTQNFFK
jgi:hypothetical protein